VAAAFSIYAGLGISSNTPSVVGERIRRFGNRRDVSVSPGRSESEPCVAPLPLLVDLLADPRARTINQKTNGTLPLADGDGAVGDPTSESVLGFAALHLC
jgi:hypothetical protein